MRGENMWVRGYRSLDGLQQIMRITHLGENLASDEKDEGMDYAVYKPVSNAIEVSIWK